MTSNDEKTVKCICGTEVIVRRKKTTNTPGGLPGIAVCPNCGRWWEAYLPPEPKNIGR